jgi:putative peptidoglycan lipid II flippase
MQSKSLIKPTLQVTFFSIIGIVISFLSQLIIAYYFGAKFERDAYFVAIIIPVYISSVLTGSLGIIFIPKVVDLMKRNSQIDLNKFIGSIVWLVLIIMFFVTCICIFFSQGVIQIVAPGYNAEQSQFTAILLKIVVPTIIFTVLGNLLGSLYQIQHKFILPALAPIVSSAISLVFVIIFSEKIGIKGLAFGFLTGSLVSMIILLPVLRNYKLSLKIDLKNADLISFVKTFSPLLMTGILFRSTGVIERMIASDLPAGSISYLGYSNQLIAVLGTLTANGIAVSAYPALSNLWSDKKEGEFSSVFTRILRIILLVSLPVALVFVFFGEEIIRIVFERGAFSREVTSAVSNTLKWSMGAFVFQSLGSIVAKVLYISGKTVVSSAIALTEVLIYLSAGYILSESYSYIGLAIALSFSSLVNILLSMMFINKRLFNLNHAKMLTETLKIMGASLTGVLSAYLLYHSTNLFIGNILSLGLSLTCGFIIFYLFCNLLNIEEKGYLKKFINTLIKK